MSDIGDKQTFQFRQKSASSPAQAAIETTLPGLETAGA
jgi:hypothetical protein